MNNFWRKIRTDLECNRNGLQLTQEFLSDQVTFGVDREVLVCDKSIRCNAMQRLYLTRVTDINSVIH